MRKRFGLLSALLTLVVSACSEVESPLVEQPEVAAKVAPLWTNGDFDSDAIGATPPSGWAVTTYLNSNGVTGSSSAPPASFAALNLATSGGKIETYVVGGAAESQTDPDLGSGQAFRFPKYGTRAARVNYKNATDSGKNQSANGLRQTMTIELGDIDPNDGQIHVRFVVAPVLENPSHGYTQQPYYFIQLQNLTRNTTLYKDFSIAGQAGVPWKTTTSVVTGNTTQWLNWQLIDLAPGPTAISVGDSVQLTVVASGCQPGGHFGRVYVDGVGPIIPGLFTWATGPSTVAAGSNIVYTVYYSNGGTSSALGAHVDMVTPPQTTYQATSASNCTAPSVGGTGTISCPLGSLAAGSSGSFTVTVAANSGATGSITNGNYLIGAVNASDLLGAKVTTSVVASTTSVADAKVTQTANVTSTNWGQAVQLSIKVKNNGPKNLNNSSTSQLAVTDVFPSQLTNVTWTCAVTNGTSTSCNPTSGTGNITAYPKLNGASNGEVTFTVNANVVSGSGTGSLTNTATAKVTSRTDSSTANNSAPLTLPIGTARTLTLTKTGSTSSGSVSSAPAAISCGTACSSTSATFIDGSSVILTATPIAGGTFSGWTGACSGSSRTCSLTISSNTSVGAAFVAPPAVGAAANVYAYRGNDQSSRTSTAFGLPLSALVTDANGNALNNVTVTFTAVPNSGASATIGTVTKTNAAGIATAAITANATAGSYTVTAAVSGVSTPATFSLTNVGAPSAITYIAGGNVSDPNRTAPSVAFPSPLTARVTDSSGNPVPGATVTFTAPASGARATFSSGTATTDTSGFASVTATANATVGSYLVTATVTGVAMGVDFSLQNVSSTPSSVFVVSGSPQRTPTSTAFDAPLVVGVADSIGNALSGVSVSFAAPGSGASATLSSSSVSTDSAGTASITATSNSTLGSYNVTASVTGAGSTSFALSNEGPQLIDVQSGDAQSKTVGQAFQTLVAIVTNSSTGAPISGATVTFAAVPVGGATATLSAASVMTNSSGLASVTATAGTVAGSYTVTASTAQAGAPATFDLTNLAGSAASIAALSGGGQHSTVSTAYADPLVAKVTDSNNNPVSGVNVTFTAPSSGAAATVTGSPATTDASGLASVTVTANATVGAFDITAAAGGAGSATFSLTNDALPGCSLDSECTNAQYCDTGPRSCTPKLANDVALPTVTGHTPPLDGTCNAPTGAAVCSSGVCGADDKCGYNTGEGPCDGSSASTVCRSSVCSVSNVCMPSGGCAVSGDCTIANAGALCTAGSCQLASCNAGYADCDNSAANGCERALGDVQNCGGCDQACSLAHAVPACSSGSCAVGACDAGYADCNNNASDGCELFVGGSDRNHCGGCSTVCTASEYCDSGSCVATLANNISCSANDQCVSGVCSADSRCGVPNNGSCGADAVCRGGACSASGACMNSGDCLVDGDCAITKFCDTAQSQCVDKLGNGTQIPMIANHTPALTGACSVAVASAVCGTGVCDTDDRCGYLNGTGTCDSNSSSICRSGVCGSDSKCGYPDLEGSCNSTSAATICRSGACTSNSQVCAAAGGCSVDADCTSLQFCDTAAHSCVAKLSNGQALPLITGHTPVLDGNCTVSVGTAVCSAGVCDAGDDRCALRNGQGPCTANDAAAICRSGVCGGDGKCGYLEGEGSCTSVDAGTVCRTGQCSTASLICVAANGCQVDADCDSVHYCDSQLDACVPKLSNGVALPTTPNHTPVLDGTCSGPVGAAVCAAGVCDPDDDRCALVNGHGTCDNSSAASVCRSGVCGADSACGYDDAEGSCTGATAGNVCRSGLCSASGVCKPLSGCVVAGDCSFSNAVAACTAGECTIASCNIGYENCNGSDADGCETDTDADLVNCGSCGAICSQANGSTICNGGSCASASCDPGYGDCNNSAVDGCETSLLVDDNANCGACGYTCPSDRFCAAGSCTLKRNNSVGCTADEQCSAGVCTDFDQLCGVIDDEPCVSAGPCRGGACSQSGVCMASNSCRVDDDCDDDSFCDTGLRRCSPKIRNAVAIPTVPGHDPELAGLCTVDVASAVCSAGVCDASDHLCGYANGTGPCTANSASLVCRSEICGGDGKCGYRDGEGTCTDSDAASVCRSGTCASSHVCLAASQCLTDGDCDATHYCDTVLATCTPKLANAVAIPTVQGHDPALNGVCTLDAGAVVCSSAVCDAGDDKCGYSNGEGPCDLSSAGRVCRGGVCGGDGACGYREGEGPCTSVDALDRCRSRLCSSASYVCVAADGCYIDGDCAITQFCDTAAHSCMPKLGHGANVPTIVGHTPALTGACNEAVGQAVCSPGVCDSSDGRCGYLNGHGACSAGAQCRSGVCTLSDQLCGALDDAPCASAEVCRGGACSQSGVCMALESCRIDADCASDAFCDTSSQRCSSKLPNATAIPSVAAHDPELAGLCTVAVGSAVCSASVCDSSDDKCGYANGSGPCTSDTASLVCRSGVCGSDGKCGYVDGGGTCTNDNDAAIVCRSGTCASSHVCLPASQCLSDDDCDPTHYCDTAESACTPKLGNARVIPIVAGHQPELHGTCTLDAGAAVCSSAVCDTSDNKCGYLNGNGQCDSGSAASVCRGGVCGGDGACGYRDGEGPCTSVDAGDRCRSGLCSASSHVCIAANGCQVDDDCPSTQFCDTAASSCTPKLGQGVGIPVIAGHTPALTGTCNDAVGHAVCSSGVCDSSDGRCGYANRSGPCTTSNAAQLCRGGVCGSDDACGYLDSEGSCNAGNAGSVCRSQLCSTVSQLCIAAAGCSVDGDCLDTHFCDTGSSRCSPKLDNGVQLPMIAGHTPALTGMCSDAVGSIVCNGGVCDSSDGRCGYVNGHGSCNAENAGAVCRSGVCGADGKCGYGDSEGSCNSANAGSLCRSQLCAASGACRPVGGCVTSSDCQVSHAAATCNGGTCGWSTCDAGYSDCNRLAADGCEVRTGGSDPSHCGACGKVCDLAHASAACNSGACAIASCESGHSNCDGLAANGCETSTGGSDSANCGACGKRCAEGELCAAGSCNAKRVNGQVCAATEECISGVCASDGACGLPDGAICSGASTCRGNACSVIGECMSTDACRADGDCTSEQLCDTATSTCQNKPNGCSVDSECADTQFCNTADATCVAKLGNATRLPILPGHEPKVIGVCSAAVGGSLCASGVCDSDDACGYLNGRGSCGEDNATRVCRSGVCGSDQKCGYLDDEGSCSSSDASVVCRSGLCGGEGRCQAAPSCLTDSDCDEDRFCDNSVQACSVKLAAGAAIPTIPGHEPPLEGVCTEAIAALICSAGVCSDSDNACAFPNELGACNATNADAMCRSGVCGSDESCGFPEGEGACTSLSAALVCRSGVCGADGRCGARPPCETDADCTDTQFCDTVQQHCRSKLRNGASLPLLASHDPPLDGKCTASAAVSVCMSSVCDEADDACGYTNGAGSCDESSAAEVCRSRACGGDGRCGFAGGEGPCDAVAALSVCRSGACRDDDLCRAVGCASDASCKQGQYCELTSGACKTRGVDGDGCTSDSECVSGSCDVARGTCNSCVDGVCGHAVISGGGCSVALGRTGPGVIVLCLLLAPLGVWGKRRWQRRGNRS